MLLTESADSTDYLLNAPNVGLLDVLKNERTGGLLKSLIVSSLPDSSVTVRSPTC
jgi:hypothetical protein